MIRNCLRLLSITTMLLLSSHAVSIRAFAADQEPGDEHWAGDLTVSGFDGYVTSLVSDRQGNVYAGGDFTAIGGEIVNHIAKWDSNSFPVAQSNREGDCCTFGFYTRPISATTSNICDYYQNPKYCLKAAMIKY